MRVLPVFRWCFALLIFLVFCFASSLTILNGHPTQYIHLGEVLFFSGGIWLILLAFVRHVWLAQLLSLPAALVLPFELWLRTEMDTPISAQSMALVLETSWGEAFNFFITYGATLGVLWVGWLAIYMASVVYAYKHRLYWAHRSYFWVLSIVVSVFFALYASIGFPPWVGENESVENSLDSKSSEGWSQQWTEVFPVNVLVAFQQYEIEKRSMEKIQFNLSKKSLGGKLIHPELSPDIVVLVIGESSTATRWELLGYHEKTNPRLSSLKNLVAFSDVVGLSLATRSAVPGVLSPRPILTPNGAVDINAEPSLLKAFFEAGYQTHWFSNQAPFGVSDTSIAVYAREAKNVRFMNPSNYALKGNVDGVLLEPLRDVLETPGRHLVVLHTLGSHFDYSMRYPDSFDYFQPSSRTTERLIFDINEKKKILSNDYNNSILYTDYFLSEITNILKIKKKKSVLAYFSDHGVDLPREGCAYHDSARMGEAAYRVPALFWLSDEMTNNTPHFFDQLVSDKDKPYTTKAMFSTLLAIGQVEISNKSAEESFLSYADKNKSPRMVATGSNFADFDKASKKNSCVISMNY